MADLAAAIQLRSIEEFQQFASLSSDAKLPLIDPMMPAFQRTVQSASYRQRIELTGVPQYGGQTYTEIPNGGDFLTNLSISFTLSPLVYTTGTYANYTNAIAHVLPRRVEFYLGEALLDRLEGDFLECEDQFTVLDAKFDADSESKGRYASELLLTSQDENTRIQTDPRTFVCPLPFSFTQSLSLALPLISLPFTRLSVRIFWNTFGKCIVFDGIDPPSFAPIMDAWLEAEFTKLDPIYAIPKYSFHQSDLRYILRQRKYIEEQIPAGLTTFQVSLDSIQAPVAAIVFFIREEEAALNNDWFNFSDYAGNGGLPIMSSARLTCDGTDIFIEREESYYRTIEPSTKTYRGPKGYVYLMSFTPHLNEHNMASGALDLKQIKNTTLWLRLSGQQTQSTVRVMALCYNIMAIKEGHVFLKDIY